MPLFFLFIGVFCGRVDILTGIFEHGIIFVRMFVIKIFNVSERGNCYEYCI